MLNAVFVRPVSSLARPRPPPALACPRRPQPSSSAAIVVRRSRRDLPLSSTVAAALIVTNLSPRLSLLSLIAVISRRRLPSLQFLVCRIISPSSSAVSCHRHLSSNRLLLAAAVLASSRPPRRHLCHLFCSQHVSCHCHRCLSAAEPCLRHRHLSSAVVTDFCQLVDCCVVAFLLNVPLPSAAQWSHWHQRGTEEPLAASRCWKSADH